MDGNTLSSPTPFTPPTTEEDRLSWLRLIRSRRVGPATFLRLMGEHGSADAALAALPGIARAAGVEGYQVWSRDEALREIDQGHKRGARLLALGDDAYPPALAALNDPPPLLWAMGRVPVAARPAVAIIGARNASSLGLRMARKLAEGLGHHGFAIVSGLARGIDAAAHGAALKTGTIAVMAGGVDRVYPPENEVLAATIADQGLRLSEQPFGLPPQARHFPRRNRLIAGLSHAVLVVEAAEGSGSLITTRDALDQGRDVLAVPGHPLDARAAGCNRLIREGARLVRGVEDVLEALAECCVRPATAPPSTETRRTGQAQSPTPDGAPSAPNGPPPDMLALHRQILGALGAAPVAEDQLLRDLGLPASVVAPALLFLELDGRVQRQPGGMLARA
jgi:DNA processing protein